jgi:excisionase family DNA binding protein
MHASVRCYRVDPQQSSELIQRIIEEFAPLIKGSQGIAEYYVVEGREGRFATISVCYDEEGVEVANKLATEWIKKFLKERLFGREQLSRFSLDVGEPISGPLRQEPSEPDGTEDSRPLGARESSREKVLEQADDQGLQLLSVQEVCEVLGMGKGWVYRQIRNGRIPSIKLGGSVKVSRADLEAYLNRNRSYEPQSEE